MIKLGIVLAFALPAYHLDVYKGGHELISVEDLTKKECEARAKTFKARAHATCVLDIGERELT